MTNIKYGDIMDSKKTTYKKPKLAVHGQIKEITMGVGSIESENDRFSFKP